MQERFVADVVDRQQFDGGDPEVLEVGERRLGGEPGVGPAQVLADLGVEHREALDVGLVDDRVGERRLGPPIALPVEPLVDHDRLRDRRRVVVVVGLVVVVGIAVGHVRAGVGVAPTSRRSLRSPSRRGRSAAWPG